MTNSIDVNDIDIVQKTGHFHYIKDSVLNISNLKSSLLSLSKDDFSSNFENLSNLEKEIFLMGVLSSNISVTQTDIKNNLLKYEDILKDIKSRNKNKQIIFCNESFDKMCR